MPLNVDLNDEDLDKIEHGGGSSKRTIAQRDAYLAGFKKYLRDKGHADISQIEHPPLEEKVWEY